MGKHFVSPTEDPNWSISPAEFVAALKRRWPESQAVESPGEYPSAEFEVQLEHSRVHGRLDDDGNTIILDADVRDVVTMAVWFRSLVPEAIQLIVYPESYSRHTKVLPSMSEEELAAAFLSHPP